MIEQASPNPPADTGAPIGFAEFVALVAALMALGALGVDAMLPGLPAIGHALGVDDANHRQFVVSTFLLGFGVAQLAHGPLADRFGRRRVLIVSLGCYALANVAAAASTSFVLLLAARFAGGAAISASRVATVAMVRDCYGGRAMARVMSIAFMMFMIVPVVAPSFGQLMLFVGSWRLIFWAIAAMALTMLGWFAARMPETMHHSRRLAFAPRRILGGWRTTIADRLSLGYTMATTALMGGLYGYLNSVQQVMAETFRRPELLALVFAVTAAAMAAANLTNSRIVMRLGTRPISHGAVVSLTLVAALHLAVALTGRETLAVFVILQAATMACFGLAAANFSAMAMEHMSALAGTASSVQGFASVTGGTILGAAIGQTFDGSTVPLIAGFFASGLAATAIVLATERGRLFARH